MTNSLRVSLLVASLSLTGPLLLPGCATDAPGIKSNFVRQWTVVDADVPAATAAAEAVLESYDLRNVESGTTQLDGVARGFRADGGEVVVEVRRARDDDGQAIEGSEVSVRVGTVGDEAIGVEIAEKVRERLAE
ncbi:MAG: hypothetical protein AAF800_07700 [Planctomycetota bacterium]